MLRAAGVGLAVVVAAWRESPAKLGQQRSRLQAMNQRLDDYQERAEQVDERRVQFISRRLAQADADAAFSERQPLTRRGAVVLTWAGMRGVVTLAAALTITADTEHRTTVVLAAALVAVTTLLVFGGTLPWVIRRLDFGGPSSEQARREIKSLFATLTEQVAGELGPLDEMTIDGKPLDPSVVEHLNRRFAPLAAGADQPPQPPDQARTAREQSLIAQRRVLDAMRDALNEERSIGAFSTATYAKVEAMLDRQETGLDAVGR